LILGFSGIRFGLFAGFLRVRAPETMYFLSQKHGQVVVIRVAAVVLLR
jgi:hypothetical protein